MNKYEYYKLYTNIYRVGEKFAMSEIYKNGRWKRSAISNRLFINVSIGKKLTKEEAFMELI